MLGIGIIHGHMIADEVVVEMLDLLIARHEHEPPAALGDAVQIGEKAGPLGFGNICGDGTG